MQDIKVSDTDEIVSTYAGSIEGYEDGPGDRAKFLIANYLVSDKLDNLYLGDYNRIRKINKEGIVSTLAGGKHVDTGGTPADGTGTNASFLAITGLALSPSGMIYVAEYDLFVRKVSPEGIVVTQNFNLGQYAGTIAIGPDSALYSIDMDDSSIFYGQWIIKQTATGVRIWRNEIPGTMSGPTVDNKGDVYFVQPGTSSIFRLSETRIIKVPTGSSIFWDKISSLLKNNQIKEVPDNYHPHIADIIDVADDGYGFFCPRSQYYENCAGWYSKYAGFRN